MRTYRFFLGCFIFFNFFLCVASVPKVSIITSLYKGEQYIEGFMRDMARQTIFDQCELIIINANSPENEEPVIRRYMKKYPNIIYKRLYYDPGIYGCWNIAIEMSRSEFITNANLDDRFAQDCYEVHLRTLENNHGIDLVYSNCYVTRKPNETFEYNSAKSIINHAPFYKSSIAYCPPHCNPMWRKSMHEKHGPFDASFKISGDWEMWCRAVEGGSMFMKAPGTHCLYYRNPDGLSTSDANDERINKERGAVIARYQHLWK